MRGLAEIQSVAPMLSMGANVPMAYRIRELRERKGWTQGQLAARSGVSQGAISLYEAGKREPSFEAGLALARAIGVDPADLVEGATRDEFLDRFQDAVLGLPDDRRDEALAILAVLASGGRAKRTR